jgi:acetyl esterase
MPLHPQCQALVDAAAAAGSPFATTDPKEARRGYDAGTLVYRHPTPALDSVANLVFAGPGGNVDARVYRPRGSMRPAPALLYFHGGGWVVGNLESHDHVCRYLAAKSGAVVIAVDYRLAPEHKFPAAYDDCRAALHWITHAASELGLDTDRFAVGGDSAGGSLAAAIALAARDAGAPRLRLQLLIYPSTDFTADTASLRDNATGYLLTSAAMQMFIDWYLPSRAERSDPRASPQLARDHAGVAPAFVQSAEFDPLRDEARIYAETLRRAGVAAEYTCYAGMVHGFARMGARVDTAFNALDDAAAALSHALGVEPR